MASIISAGTSAGTALNLTGDTSGSLALATNNGTTALTINTSQNVGIGTSTLTYRLNVSDSNSRVWNKSFTTGHSIIHNENDGGSLYFAIDNSTGTAFGNGNYARVIRSTGAYPLTFDTNSTERMRIDSSGNVGIGLSTLAEKFEVNGSINASTTSSNSFSGGNARAFMDYVPGTNTARFGQLNGASGLTNGTTIVYGNQLPALNLSATGNMTTPYQSAFIAYMSSSASTATTIPFNQTSLNRGGNFNTGNYTYTAPIAGLYFFNLIITYDGSGTNPNTTFISLYVNGTRSRDFFEGNPAWTTNTEWHSPCIYYLNGGDTVTIGNPSGANIQGGNASFFSLFSGYLIG